MFKLTGIRISTDRLFCRQISGLTESADIIVCARLVSKVCVALSNDVLTLLGVGMQSMCATKQIKCLDW